MNIGTKVTLANRNPNKPGPGMTATVVEPTAREWTRKGKRSDGVIVPKVFLQLDDENKTRAWFPIAWLEPPT